jgi:hypothetical protein
LKVLKKKVRPIYKQIAAQTKPTAKKKTRSVYKRRASKRQR